MNKKILVIGHKGYIGRNVINYLELRGYDIATDINTDTYYDIVIDCAFKGVRSKSPQDLRDNLVLIYKVLSLNYGKLIYFSSGYMQQYQVNYESSDYYLAKKVIYDILKYNSNAIIVNLYNCFGGIQPNGRFIKNCIDNYIHGKSMTVNLNILIPMVSIRDLLKLIIDIIQNNVNDKVIDIGYEEIMSYLEIAEYINTLSNKRVLINTTDIKEFNMTKDFNPTYKLTNTLKSQIKKEYEELHG